MTDDARDNAPPETEAQAGNRPENRHEDRREEAQFGLTDDFIAEIRELLAQDYTDRIQELCRELSPPDAADLLAKTGTEERARLAEILENNLDPETFAYLDPEVLNDLLENVPGPQVAGIVSELESDDAIALLDGLPEERRAGILRSLSRKVRAELEEGLTFPEKSAGRLMQRDFVAVPQSWTVGKTVDYLRAAAENLPDTFHDIFVVDPMHRLVGAVPASHILCAQRPARIESLMQAERATLSPETHQEQAARLFRRKDLLSAPVVDKDNRLIGVVTVDDIVDVIDEEAEEDFLSLGGVSDSDVFRPALPTARARYRWLFINLFTAFAAVFVVSRFEDTIGRIVALAALMPVVASMGGNAGMQALAVAVRALATKELTFANAWRFTLKECAVGVANGLMFGIMLGVFVGLAYGDPRLGAVIGSAMALNLFVAGTAGALIPLALHRLGFDPAHSAAVFLTTVTDVVGFFAFLGLATWVLL